MKLIDLIPYRVASIFACALINGDTSAMDEDDDKLLEKFIAEEGGEFTIPTDSYGEYAPTEFVRCEVSGLMADCVLVERMVYAPESP